MPRLLLISIIGAGILVRERLGNIKNGKAIGDVGEYCV